MAIVEESGVESVRSDGTILGNDFSMISSADDSLIRIGDVNYSMNLPGINIAVYDKSQGIVIDRINFCCDEDWTNYENFAN